MNDEEKAHVEFLIGGDKEEAAYMTFRTMGETPFYVIEITDAESLERLFFMCQAMHENRTIIHSARFGIDFGDSGFKFSVNGSTWSPPIKGKL